MDQISTPSYQEYACRLFVNNIPLASSYEIISIQAKQAYQWISSANILLKVDVSFGESLFSNPLEVLPLSGQEIEIIAVGTGNEVSLFKGLIVKHKYTNSPTGTRVHLTAKHSAINLSMNKKAEVYADKNDKDIIEEIVQSVGLNTSFIQSQTFLGIQHKRLVKSGFTDWDFINMRAEANLSFVYTEPDIVVVEKPILSLEPAKQVSAIYGINVYSLEMEQDDRLNLIEHQFIHFDPSDQNSVVQSEENFVMPSLTSTIKGTKQDIFSASFNEMESKQALDSVIQLKNLSKVNGLVHIHANLNVKPGYTLIVEGYQAEFNEHFIITSVLHDFSGGIFSTYLQFGMHHESFATKYQPASSQHYSKGMINGIVVALEGDPDNLSRVLVSVPLWNRASENIWARYVSPYAGNEYGMIWLPEIGDEVLIGFIGEEFEMPVVLGSMYSPAMPPFESFSDDNFKKGIQTKKGMKWNWDDEKGIHEISVANGSKILISEDENLVSIEDANGNSVILNDSGMEIKSALDIKIEGGGKVDISAGSELNLKAMNMNFNADGILTLKGSLIKIN
ncbi:MAG: hypothetical protein KA198_02625 [Chitinophagaceae bacterium]|nr:hypothetical protein [Chitinophagaceae bacterium]